MDLYAHMALGNLPAAANGLPVVPIGNDIQDTTRIVDNIFSYYFMPLAGLI